MLLEQELVDEVILIVYPALLGLGKRFFSDSADPRELAFVGTKATPTGVLLNSYRYVGSLRGQPLAGASVSLLGGRYMPVPPAFAESNRAQTERLRTLVGRLDASSLAVRLPNGWTVAVALAHIAFWDRQRLCLMRRWAAGNWCSGGYDGGLFNEVLLPFLETILPDRAAEMALKTAEEVDAFLLTVPDEVVGAALARPDRPNLDRGSHREGHLDEIEKALAGFAGDPLEARL